LGTTMLTCVIGQAMPERAISHRQERARLLSERENLRRRLFPEMDYHDEGYSG